MVMMVMMVTMVTMMMMVVVMKTITFFLMDTRKIGHRR